MQKVYAYTDFMKTSHSKYCKSTEFTKKNTWKMWTLKIVDQVPELYKLWEIEGQNITEKWDFIPP